MLYDGCLERAEKPMSAGGCQSLNGALELYGLVDAGDSAFAIKKLIYDERCFDRQRACPHSGRNQFLRLRKKSAA
ncbi:MAG: pyruvate formate lyase family protein [Oscillospiraceae bacterium]